jgi:hypothetical protein
MSTGGLGEVPKNRFVPFLTHLGGLYLRAQLVKRRQPLEEAGDVSMVVVVLGLVRDVQLLGVLRLVVHFTIRWTISNSNSKAKNIKSPCRWPLQQAS